MRPRGPLYIAWTALSLLFALSWACAQPPQPQVRIGADLFALRVTEGVQQTPVPVTWQLEQQVWRGRAGELSFVVQPARSGPLMVLDLALNNEGGTRRLIEVALVGQMRLDPDTARYWDGSYRDVSPLEGFQPGAGDARERGSFPLSALGDAEHAVIMGITPTTLISYAEPWLDYHPGDQSTWGFSLRAVLEPAVPERVALCLGPITGLRYGFLAAAWETYQRAFPEYFRPHEGVPDGVWLTSSVYQSWYHPPDREWLRRLWCGWDWCYAPFKRAGDMYCREEDWDYQPLGKPLAEAKATFIGRERRMAEETLEQFRRDRQEYFATYGLDCGQLFYTPSGIWVEKQLAQQRFPDAIVVNDAIPTQYTIWVTHWDTEVLVQPTGTSYATRLLEDYRLLLQELDISGFAFDVCTAGQRNYGPGAERPIRGRSWDERGVFFDLGISMVQQMNFIRGLDTSRLPYDTPAIIGPGASFTAWHGDGALLELTLTDPHKYNVPVMAMALGAKPGVIWKGYDLHVILPDWEKLSRREFLTLLAKLADYVYLKSFQWGLYPGINYEVGMDKWQRAMPLLVELVQSGWHPLAPVALEADAELWVGRYGAGADTSLALANPNEEAVQVGVTVDNRFLGSSSYVLVDRKRPEQALSQTLADGSTALTVTAPRRQVTVLRAVAGVKSRQTLHVSASMSETISTKTVSLRLSVPETELVGLEWGAWPGFEVQRVQVNGQVLEPEARLVELPAGESTIAVNYAARFLHFDQQQLDRFALLTEAGEMNFQVVAPEPQRRDYRRVAERFDRYFRFYAKEVLKHDAAPLVVVTDPAQVTAPLRLELTIGAGNDNAGWSLSADGAALRLSASDEREAVRRTEELLRILDRRFEYFAPFKAIGNLHWKFFPAFGLQDRLMSELMAEEGLQW